MRRLFLFFGPKGRNFFEHRNELGGILRGIIVKCITNGKKFGPSGR